MSLPDAPSPEGPTAQRQLRVLGAVTLSLAAGAACLVAYAIHGSLPYNPIALPGEKQLLTRTWAPEGWKFFTRNPQEERPVLFAQRLGAWERAEAGPASRPRYLFGLNREGRAQGLEFGLILEQIPASAWRDCSTAPLTCISAAEKPLHLTNRSPEPTLCGAIGVALQKPIPWAWLDLPRPVVMPSRFVLLEVQC